MCWDEGAYAHHLRPEAAYELQVGVERVKCLVRRAHHESASHLVACLLEFLEAVHAVLPGHLRRMQAGIVRYVVPVF